MARSGYSDINDYVKSRRPKFAEEKSLSTSNVSSSLKKTVPKDDYVTHADTEAYLLIGL